MIQARRRDESESGSSPQMFLEFLSTGNDGSTAEKKGETKFSRTRKRET
jgi:hypothetical protein